MVEFLAHVLEKCFCRFRLQSSGNKLVSRARAVLTPFATIAESRQLRELIREWDRIFFLPERLSVCGDVTCSMRLRRPQTTRPVQPSDTSKTKSLSIACFQLLRPFLDLLRVVGE